MSNRMEFKEYLAQLSESQLQELLKNKQEEMENTLNTFYDLQAEVADIEDEIQEIQKSSTFPW